MVKECFVLVRAVCEQSGWSICALVHFAKVLSSLSHENDAFLYLAVFWNTRKISDLQGKPRKDLKEVRIYRAYLAFQSALCLFKRRASKYHSNISPVKQTEAISLGTERGTCHLHQKGIQWRSVAFWMFPKWQLSFRNFYIQTKLETLRGQKWS